MLISLLTITLCLLLSLDSGHRIKSIRMGAGLVGRGYATKSENFVEAWGEVLGKGSSVIAIAFSYDRGSP